MLDLAIKDEESTEAAGGCRVLSEDYKLELRLGPPPSSSSSSFAHGASASHNNNNNNNDNNSKNNNREEASNNALDFDHQQSSNCVSQKRVAPSVIGWPPIRSFRKKVTANTYQQSPEAVLLIKPNNIASNISANPESNNIKDNINSNNNNKKQQLNLAVDQLIVLQQEAARDQELLKNKVNVNVKVDVDSSLYVKIYMDGIPIGRKVNLKAHNNYNSLSSAVDHLFRCLLPHPPATPADQAVGSDGTTCKSSQTQQHENDTTSATAGLLEGNGDYTLVYQDNEGDTVLVGDVPWDMFLSTVKRLRVLKSSELPAATNKLATAAP